MGAMRTLVLGERGWIGSALANNSRRLEVSKIDSTLSKDQFKSWLFAQSADCYINCIGKMSGTSSEMEWANVSVVELLLDHAKKTNARVINLGSAAEYGRVNDKVLDENLVPNPISLYGKQKLIANQMLNEFVTSGGSGVATRLFNVVGTGQSNKTSLGDVISRMNRSNLEDEVVIDNYDIVRDYVSINFVADVLANLPSSSFSGTLNIGSGKPVAFFDLLKEIGDFYGVTPVCGVLHDNRIFSAVSSTKKLEGLGLEIEDLKIKELAILATSGYVLT
jgi:nucleoside-diphosphate-sugar epimerase